MSIAAVPNVSMGAAAPLPSIVGMSVVSESPELLAIGAELVVAMQHHADAVAAKDAAVARAVELCPPIPADIRFERPRGIYAWAGDWHSLDEERDVCGQRVVPPIGADGETIRPARVVTAERLRRRQACVLQGKSLKAEIVRLEAIANKYEIAREAAIDAAGLDDAFAVLDHAVYSLTKLALQCRKIEPRTLAGVLIKAQAANACARTGDSADSSDGKLDGKLKAGWIGAALAGDIERLLGGASS